MLRRYEQYLYLQAIDQLWKDHLLSMDHLRQGIGLRGYGQKDPKQEYKKEGYEMFVRHDLAREGPAVVGNVLRLAAGAAGERRGDRGEAAGARRRHCSGSPRATPRRRDGEAPRPPSRRRWSRQAPKVGRNDPCPCGSGKKYKKCHGANEAAA